MAKTLTITVDDAVYEGLLRAAGSEHVSLFIERLIRPHVVDLDAAYAEMANDEAREADALAWSEALMDDEPDGS